MIEFLGVFKSEHKSLTKLEEFQQHLETENEADAPNNSNLVIFHNKNEKASSFRESYSSLREWIYSALDIYRVIIFL